MQIKVYSGFAKRKNSTKQPTGGTDVNCVLKDPCRILAPVFELSASYASTNYVYVASWSRYYFVTDVEYVTNDIILLHCAVDVLASYKSSIASTSAFIQYATGGSNLIIDTRLPMKSGLTAPTPATESFPWTIDPLGGRYFLTVMSKTGVKTYNMTYLQLIALMQDLDTWTDDIFNNIPTPGANIWDAMNYQTQVVFAIGKQIMSFRDAGGCLVNCVWVPINYTGGASAERVYLGNYDTGHDASPMLNLVETQTVQVAIPWAFSDWRNNSPYCQMYLYIPFVGNIQIDPSLCIGQTVLNLKFGFSRCSGDCSLQVKAGSGITIGTYSVNFAAKYPVGAMQADPIKQIGGVGAAVGGVAAAVGGIVTGNVPAVIGGVTAIAASPASFNPTPSVMGGMGGGSGAGLDSDIRLVLLYHDTAEAPGSSNATIGKPVMSTHVISTYSGYIQASGASVPITGTDEEKTQVNAYVNGGFFYE